MRKCLSVGAHFPCLMEVGTKQHAMCLHFTHHEVWMTDSKVSLHCNGHGQIDGAWLSENCHFPQNVTKLFLINQIKSRVLEY